MAIPSFSALSGRDAAILLGHNTALELVEKIKRDGGIDEAGNTGAAAVNALIGEARERGFDPDSQAVIESFVMTICEELAALLSDPKGHQDEED